jgi:hypothetical protein
MEFFNGVFLGLCVRQQTDFLTARLKDGHMKRIAEMRLKNDSIQSQQR